MRWGLRRRAAVGALALGFGGVALASGSIPGTPVSAAAPDDGTVYVLAETDSVNGFDDEVFLASWPSVGEFFTHDGFVQQKSEFPIASSFDTRGFHIADDGTVYVLAETDSVNGFDDEVFLASWPSVGEFLTHDGFVQQKSEFPIASSFDTRGFHIADDGTVYVLAETDSVNGFDDEVFLASWPSVGEFLTHDGFVQQKSEFPIASSFDTRGFHIADDGTVYVLAETDSVNGFDDEVFLASWPSVGEFLTHDGFVQQKSEFPIASSFDTRGLYVSSSLPDSDGDGVPDDEDVCAGEDDTIDVDADGIPDCIDPLIDSDNDGVPDDEDVCAGEDDTIDVDADGIPDCIDPLIDSDNDGVPDDEDVCAGEDDTIDVDADGIPDCIDPLIDSDNDGVADDQDVSADTSEDPAPDRLKKNRVWPEPLDSFGCSASQIIEDAELGEGHRRFGISTSALREWRESIDG